MPIDKTMTQTEIQKQPKLHTPKQQQQHHDATQYWKREEKVKYTYDYDDYDDYDVESRTHDGLVLAQ